MSRSKIYPISDAMDICALCNTRKKALPGLGMYGLGRRGAIQYPVCSDCFELAKKGLRTDQFCELEQTVEVRAIALGLIQLH